MNHDPEKCTKCYIDIDLAGIWNQKEGKNPRLVLSRMGYVINYHNLLIIWARLLYTRIVLITMEAEYISIYQAIRDVLPFVSLMKKIESVLKLQGDTLTVLCSIFENPVTVYEENQGAVALTVSLQMLPCKKHIMINYHHLQIFVVNSDVEIKHVDTKEHIADIFTKPLDSEFFIYLPYKINGWWVHGILLHKEF